MAGRPSLETLTSTAGIAEPHAATAVATPRFEVRLTNFTGPFDLLLGLISKHELDITDVAIATVTDEFLSYLADLSELGGWALDEASEFLVLAATLLDLKAARLLPDAAGDTAEDLALLEARDLLFARLLQYRAFKEVATVLGRELVDEARRYPRMAGLEEQFATLLPELVWTHSPDEFAALAVRASAPTPAPATEVALTHLHDPRVTIAEQVAVLTGLLTADQPDGGAPAAGVGRQFSFHELTADAADTTVVIARFLALLELFREARISFEQRTPLGELLVRWGTGVSA